MLFRSNNSPIGQQNVTLGVEFNIRDKVPQIDGSNRRIFVGWNTKIDGSGDFYNEKQTIMPNEYFLSTLDDQQRLFAIFDEQIVITRPHTGWAYSNIYGDGTKLTFIDEYLLDANDNEIPESEYNKIEQYQGVFFKWGSLVALSPRNELTTTVNWLPQPYTQPGVAGNNIIYIPTTNSSFNGGWNPQLASNNSWNNIPYVYNNFNNDNDAI